MASKENIADLPSRESYRLLEDMGAAWVKPEIGNAFLEPAEWKTVALEAEARALAGSKPHTHTHV